MHLDEITKYKQEIMKQICKNEAILQYIRPKNAPDMAGRDMLYKYVFPYSYVPETTQEASTFLCFDVDIPNVQNRTFKDCRIMVWMFCHNSLMRCEKGTRLDLLADEIDRMLNGSRAFGLGTLELDEALRFHPVADYWGRELAYNAVDFNRR